jgi:hypothetical protein
VSFKLELRLSASIITEEIMHLLFCFLQSRGSTRDGTGVHDSIVNQLLTKVGEEFSVISDHLRKSI